MKWIIALAVAMAPSVGLCQGAGGTVNSLPSSPAIIGGQLVYCPVGSSYDYKCTFYQIGAFVQSYLSGAVNVWNGGNTFNGPTTIADLTGLGLANLPLCTPGSSIAPVPTGFAFQCSGVVLIAQ